MATKKTTTRGIRHELLDELLAGYSQPDDLTGPEGLLKQLTGALVERALQAEMTDHLGYEPHASEGHGGGNARNGVGTKTLVTDHGKLPIEVPRDRNGTFEPKLIKKHQRRFKGFDDKILSMYARGMSVRDIQAHLAEMYGTDVRPFFAFPTEVRKIIYTTNAIESLNFQLRKVTKAKGHFPTTRRRSRCSSSRYVMCRRNGRWLPSSGESL